MAELEGKTLGRYELQRLIGKGGMANVYEAFDRLSERALAVKIFKREDDEMLRRFLREARLMSSLHGHHLMPIYDSGTEVLDNTLLYYIAMPYMEGGTLRVRIRRGPLTLDECCRAIREIADALDYVHSRGIIHRDIKASNVLIDSNGSYYLTDFGIARIADDMTHLTTTGNVLGTVDYVAPELFEPDRRADAYSDYYSLGVLLYEMVMGRLPFIAENQIALVTMHMRLRPPAPRSLDPAIPEPVERVMLKALEKRPEQRYHSATELAAAFCAAVAGLPEPVVPVVPEVRQGQLILSPPGDEPGVVPGEHASPLAGGTIGSVAAYQPAGHAVTPSASAASSAVEAPPIPPIPAPGPTEPREKGSGRAARPFYRQPWFALLAGLLALAIIAGSLFQIIHPHAGSSISATKSSTATAGSPQQLSSPPATATPNLTATAIAAYDVTATAQAQASATAIARMTATAQAQASATAGVIATATSGQPVYQDPLDNPSNPATSAAGWDSSDNCAILNDGYHVTTSNGYQGCKEANNSYTDAAITVDMSIRGGLSGGLFFRMHTIYPFNTGPYAGYLFEVDGNGRYRVLSSGDYDNSSATVLKDWTPSSALRQGSATNTLQVITQGNNLSFFVNGVFLTSLSDSGYSSGLLAFLARSDGTTPADVVYTDLAVYTLG